MKTIHILLLTLLWVLPVGFLSAQLTITGTVVDETGEPAISANVIIKGSYNGTSTDFSGQYSIELQERDTLVFSYLGYQDRIVPVAAAAGQTQTIDIRLEPIVNLLTQAIVSASKQKEISRLSSANLDQFQVFTTAGDPGNILTAAQGGSSAAVNPATGRLLARGGRARETQFYQDGLLLSSPYVNTVGGVSSRLKQNPYMIAGIDLYNGTASAEYGQALSSIVELRTKQNIRSKRSTVSVSTVGLNANFERPLGKGGLIFNSDLLDLRLNNALTVTNLEWQQPFRSWSNQLLWERRQGQDRTLKVYANHTTNSMRLDTYYAGQERDVKLRGQQSIASLSYHHLLSNKWDLTVGAAAQQEINKTDMPSLLLEEEAHRNIHVKSVLKYYGPKDLLLKMGAEYFLDEHEQFVRFQPDTLRVDNHLQTNRAAFFAEAEQEPLESLTVRFGLRANVSNGMTPNLAVRALLGYQLHPRWSVSGFYGTFYQDPAAQLRYYQAELKQERSEQLIMTLDYHEKKRAYSLAWYRKNYHNLVRYPTDYQYQPSNINSNGKGFVDGVDVALEDRETIDGGEIRLGYSYTYSLRNDGTNWSYVNPAFLYRHQGTLLVRKFLPGINSNVSVSAILADGKFFDNPYTTDVQEKDEVGMYHSLSFNYTYLTRIIGNRISYLHLSVDNVLNTNNEVGLHYTEATGAVALNSNNRRSLFLALIINF